MIITKDKPAQTRALEPIGRTLLFSAACHAMPIGIQWTRIPTEEELHADDFLIQRCGESVGWWTGDIVNALHSLKGVDKSLVQFAGEYARIRGINEEQTVKYAQVSRFYPVTDRRNKPASWTHHRTVWESSASPNLHACLTWLDRSIQGDGEGKPWSTGRLREELAKAGRAASEPKEPTAPTGEYEAITRIEAWAAQSLPRVSTINAIAAREMLRNMASTVALIDGLRERAAKSA